MKALAATIPWLLILALATNAQAPDTLDKMCYMLPDTLFITSSFDRGLNLRDDSLTILFAGNSYNFAPKPLSLPASIDLGWIPIDSAVTEITLVITASACTAGIELHFPRRMPTEPGHRLRTLYRSVARDDFDMMFAVVSGYTGLVTYGPRGRFFGTDFPMRERSTP